MIASKIKAVLLLRKMRYVESVLEESLQVVDGESAEEKAFLAQAVGCVLAAVLTKIDYPIIAKHPELRPIELLGGDCDRARYTLKTTHDGGMSEEVVAVELSCEAARNALRKYEESNMRTDAIFWLELEI